MNPADLPNLEIKRTIWQDLDDFQKFMSEFHQSLSDPEQKQAFGQMLDQLQKAQAEAQALAPGVLKEIQQDAEKTKVEAEAFLKEVEQAKQDVEQMEKDLAEAEKQARETAGTVPTPPLEPQPTVDPHLGVALGQEILSSLGGLAATAAGTRAVEDLGSVAEAWVEPAAESGQKDEPVPQRAAQKSTLKRVPRPSAKPSGPKKPNSDDDIWEGLSRMED